MATTLRHLLDDLGARMGLTLALDDLGTARLWIDDMLVTLTAGADDAHLTAIATPGAPGGDRRETLRLLLRANYLWAGTGGATLSLAGSGDVVLMNRWPAGIDAQRLSDSFAAFLDAAAYWSAVLAAADDDRPDAGPSDFIRA